MAGELAGRHVPNPDSRHVVRLTTDNGGQPPVQSDAHRQVIGHELPLTEGTFEVSDQVGIVFKTN